MNWQRGLISGRERLSCFNKPVHLPWIFPYIVMSRIITIYVTNFPNERNNVEIDDVHTFLSLFFPFLHIKMMRKLRKPCSLVKKYNNRKMGQKKKSWTNLKFGNYLHYFKSFILRPFNSPFPSSCITKSWCTAFVSKHTHQHMWIWACLHALHTPDRLMLKVLSFLLC